MFVFFLRTGRQNIQYTNRQVCVLQWPCIFSNNYSDLKLEMLLSTENLMVLMTSLLTEAQGSL